MPYYASRTKTYKKGYRKGTSRAPNKNYIAKVARSVVRAEAPRREARFNLFHALDTTAVPASTFGINHLTNIVIGDNVDMRTGKSIYLKGVKFNVSMTNNSVVKPRVVRVMVVHTKNKDGDLLDTLTWTDLYQNTAFSDRTADGLSGDIISPINTDILDVYLDKRFTLSQETANRASTVWSQYLKIDRKFHYDDAGSPGVTPQMISGRLYVIFHVCEPDDTLGTAVTRVTGMARVFFRDA